nr:LamG-like jellyroll fold domain-containing protein [uncultured Flavobacterium sp.]
MANAQYFGLLQQSTTTSYSDLNLASFGPENDVIVTTTIASGTWFNYIVTYDGLTSKNYRNAELIKSSICSIKLNFSVVFGIGKMGSAVSMNADIDDLKNYNVVLSAEEVASMYNSGSILVSNDEPAVPVTAKGAVKKTVVKTTPKKAAVKSNVVLSTPVEIMNPKISEIYSSQALKVLSGDKNEIDITTLPEGNYLLKVSNMEQSTNSNKLTAN